MGYMINGRSQAQNNFKIINSQKLWDDSVLILCFYNVLRLAIYTKFSTYSNQRQL